MAHVRRCLIMDDRSGWTLMSAGPVTAPIFDMVIRHAADPFFHTGRPRRWNPHGSSDTVWKLATNPLGRHSMRRCKLRPLIAGPFSWRVAPLANRTSYWPQLSRGVGGATPKWGRWADLQDEQNLAAYLFAYFLQRKRPPPPRWKSSTALIRNEMFFVLVHCIPAGELVGLQFYQPIQCLNEGEGLKPPQRNINCCEQASRCEGRWMKSDWATLIQPDVSCPQGNGQEILIWSPSSDKHKKRREKRGHDDPPVSKDCVKYLSFYSIRMGCFSLIRRPGGPKPTNNRPVLLSWSADEVTISRWDGQCDNGWPSGQTSLPMAITIKTNCI